MNGLLFPASSHELCTPSSCVSDSEHDQIASLLDGFVRNVTELNLDIAALQRFLHKPLKPIWITRDTALLDDRPAYDDFTLIVLCTASRRVHGAELTANGYIQGAADDSESWAQGLEPTGFWSNRDLLLQAPESELESIIAEITGKGVHAGSNDANRFVQITPTQKLWVGAQEAITHLQLSATDLVITCGDAPHESAATSLKKRYLHLQCRPKKLGSKDLRTQLPNIRDFLGGQEQIGTIFISCDTGRDLSIGVALVLLCQHFDDLGQWRQQEIEQKQISKALVRQRLAWIMAAFPAASPSRATLQACNDYLFSTKIT